MVMSFRPLARRRESTFAPFFVLIRARNPWIFALARFFGWYVRFGIAYEMMKFRL